MSEACCGNILHSHVNWTADASIEAGAWACRPNGFHALSALQQLQFSLSTCFQDVFIRIPKEKVELISNPPFKWSSDAYWRKYVRQKIWLPATDPTLLIVVGLTFTIKCSVDGHDFNPGWLSHSRLASNLTLRPHIKQVYHIAILRMFSI